MPRQNPDYHVNWSTKYRQSQVTGDVEEPIYAAIVHKASQLGGYVHAINGMPEHVHLVVRIPVTIAVSTFVGQVKGYSSHCANKLPNFDSVDRFEWQGDYEVEGIHSSLLQRVIEYVLNQKEHHRAVSRA